MSDPFAKEPRWVPQAQVPRNRIPRAVLDWLLDSSSLTERLRRHCEGRLRVRVIDQTWARPERGEAQALGIRYSERALVRQVQLLGNGEPWVFARTVIPVRSLQGPQRRLARLGTKPLGAVLFTDKSMRRENLELVSLLPGQTLFETAARDLPQRPGMIWGRRSVFWLGERPLLVSEMFLPGLLASGKEGRLESGR